MKYKQWFNHNFHLVSNWGLSKNYLIVNFIFLLTFIQTQTLYIYNPNMNNNYIALDCEMVGSGNRSLLARVSLVNSSGSCIYDKYVKPTQPVTDYRTFVSGIKSQHLRSGEDFGKVQREVQNFIQGRILVGHSLQFDLEVLGLSHPERNIRDIAKYEQFKRLNNGNPPSLQLLARHCLGQIIHNHEHDSVEDAKVAMRVYQTVARTWP